MNDGVQGSSQKGFLNDMHVLNILNMHWIKVRTSGIPRKARAGHCSAVYGTKILVFGGLNSEGYLPPDILQIEFNQQRARWKVR